MRPRGGGLNRHPSHALSLTILVASFLAAVVKWFCIPLWSWDHFANWGLKAKKFIQDGMLDFGFLQLPGFHYSNSDYPIGVPLAWRALSLALPEEMIFKSIHLLFALCLVLVVRNTCVRTAGSSKFANIVAAFVCISPLFWDTENLGLAELPLAFFACAAIANLLEVRDSGVPAWTAGWMIGFLSWVKKEGLLLSLLLLLFGVVLFLRNRARQPVRPGSITTLVVPAVLLQLSSILVGRFLLGPGADFFAGDWRARAIARLSRPFPIVSALGSELLRREWWGIWLILAAAFAYAVLCRREMAALLLGIVFAMLASYGVVYFATYLDPLQHLHNSFFRTASALVPLGAIGIGFLLGEEGPVVRPT